ncbi:hypothetical protein PLICRDRAFT_181139 [Plicaturopsis crispa FD-325 SS-3]|uniref:Uncharacterized protein n=1 Tax=Plicaturopsis crispa FD-325 SS-3 TaxID=944288 RepID=A0A0C9SV06_PLICR|nr:hypothetical protein PLICRDRAFT_181139 [Plicaturopsis crispa FD-325 SS-3]
MPPAIPKLVVRFLGNLYANKASQSDKSTAEWVVRAKYYIPACTSDLLSRSHIGMSYLCETAQLTTHDYLSTLRHPTAPATLTPTATTIRARRRVHPSHQTTPSPRSTLASSTVTAPLCTPIHDDDDDGASLGLVIPSIVFTRPPTPSASPARPSTALVSPSTNRTPTSKTLQALHTPSPLTSRPPALRLLIFSLAAQYASHEPSSRPADDASHPEHNLASRSRLIPNPRPVQRGDLFSSRRRRTAVEK